MTDNVLATSKYQNVPLQPGAKYRNDPLFIAESRGIALDSQSGTDCMAVYIDDVNITNCTQLPQCSDCACLAYEQGGSQQVSQLHNFIERLPVF